MPRPRTPPIRVTVLLVIGSLLVLGLAQAAWSLRLEILGTINTSDAAMNFVASFTDDDGLVNDAGLDPDDNAHCPAGGSADSSCDPTSVGPGPKARLDRDVARCTAAVEPDGLLATIVLDEAYPEYNCTAWFAMRNPGSLPLRIGGLRLNDQSVGAPSQTSADLNGDGQPDLAFDLSGFGLCQQLDPGQQATLQFGQRILSSAPRNTSLSFTILVEFQQWNADCEASAEPAQPEEASP